MPISDLERQSPALEGAPPSGDSVPVAGATAAGGERAPLLRRTRNSAEATEQMFLAAARNAFSAKGYSRTTVQDIVAGTGLSRAAFYQYFRGTHDVFLQIIGAVVDEVLASSRVRSGTTLRERVHAGNRRYLEIFMANRGLIRAIAEAAYVNPEIAGIRSRMRRAYLRRVRDHLERQRSHGRCHPIDPDAAALSLGLMVEGAAHSWAVAGLEPFERPLDLDRLCTQVTEIWCRAVYLDPDAR
ncbi:TetR/AcrR family transcriptional regulator [Quisquiliibacterium transsilvanicum]|uniref:AcrR family transcriptional regulator n=1 Tax=Quisquiliibacterium transsilvanicum TaxID=1549638 RepID=A0A7W8HLP5_9BURK|nr:TetR/AcrR family transcriptional regulator [Quisquiliibacterium transsilvanicum]MBB5273681.1 AcrR family transcriptional regulator [Quisquiliibacterium transsilvanicum]